MILLFYYLHVKRKKDVGKKEKYQTGVSYFMYWNLISVGTANSSIFQMKYVPVAVLLIGIHQTVQECSSYTEKCTMAP